MALNSNKLDEAQTTELAEVFHLMGDVSRLKIILCCLNEPVSVGVIAKKLGFSGSLVSHHLRLLRAARLIRSERKGKYVYCVVADEHIRCVLQDMVDHVSETGENIEDL